MKGNSVPFGEHLQRRRAALVSWLALAVAVGGVVTYAVQADGYQAHRADLNDGGIWVTSKHDGSYGRINKPIGELDGTVFSSPDSNLDIVQDGDSVVGVNLSDGVVVPLDPAQMKVPDGEEAAIPGSPVVGMAGGSLAVLDASTGDLWAAREDPEVGVPSVATLADQADPLAEVGEDAAMAVTLDGAVLAASGPCASRATRGSSRPPPRTSPVTPSATPSRSPPSEPCPWSSTRPAAGSSSSAAPTPRCLRARSCSRPDPARPRSWSAHATRCCRSTWPPAR